MAINFISSAKHKPCAIFAVFTQYESILGVDDRSQIIFLISQGMLPWQSICVIPDFFARSRSISGSAGPIFTIFAPYGRY